LENSLQKLTEAYAFMQQQVPLHAIVDNDVVQHHFSPFCSCLIFPHHLSPQLMQKGLATAFDPGRSVAQLQARAALAKAKDYVLRRDEELEIRAREERKQEELEARQAAAATEGEGGGAMLEATAIAGPAPLNFPATVELSAANPHDVPAANALQPT
jgi:hypothetical protein